jgi:hypothetical protein
MLSRFLSSTAVLIQLYFLGGEPVCPRGPGRLDELTEL